MVPDLEGRRGWFENRTDSNMATWRWIRTASRRFHRQGQTIYQVKNNKNASNVQQREINLLLIIYRSQF